MADVSIKIEQSGDDDESDDDIPLTKRVKMLQGQRKRPKMLVPLQMYEFVKKEETTDDTTTSEGILVGRSGYMMDAINHHNAAKEEEHIHLTDRQSLDVRNDSHELAKDNTSAIVKTSNFVPQYPQKESDSQEILSPRSQGKDDKCVMQAKPTGYEPSVRRELVPFDVNNVHNPSFPTCLVNVKVETLESDLECQYKNTVGISPESKMGGSRRWEESDWDVIDHMPLRQRKELLSARNSLNLDSSINLKCLRTTLPSSDKTNNSETGKPEGIIRRRKRRKTATDSVETALEEDAPGLLKVLVEKGILLDEIKLYGEDTESGDPLDISSEDSFGDLEDVVSKLFSQRSSILKFAPLHSKNVSKTSYCLACLLSLVEQARYLLFRKWPVEWGWCRDLQSFIFVFERHNRIVLERPEYGFATYFFELADSLPIGWQIKRLVTSMKLTSCSRTTLIENKSLLVGEDLTDGEARVLEEYGWTPNTGLGTMLNYCDRVVHDRKNHNDISEWRSKIGKMLMNGYDGGTIVLSQLPKKFKDYKRFKGYEHPEDPKYDVEVLN